MTLQHHEHRPIDVIQNRARRNRAKQRQPGRATFRRPRSRPRPLRIKPSGAAAQDARPGSAGAAAGLAARRVTAPSKEVTRAARQERARTVVAMMANRNEATNSTNRAMGVRNSRDRARGEAQIKSMRDRRTDTTFSMPSTATATPLDLSLMPAGERVKPQAGTRPGCRGNEKAQPASCRNGMTRFCRPASSSLSNSSNWIASWASNFPEVRRRRVARWAPQPSLRPRSSASVRT